MTSQPFRVKYGIDASSQQITNLADPGQMPTGAMDAVNLRTLLANSGLKLTARVGDLPTPNDPTLGNRPRDGQAFLVLYDLGGQDLNRIAVWDSNRNTTGGIAQLVVDVPPTEVANVQAEAAGGGSWPGEVFTGVGGGDAVFDITPNADGTMTAAVTTAGTGYAIGDTYSGGPYGAINSVTVRVERLAGATPNGGWRFVDLENWIKTSQAAQDHAYGMEMGDFQSTTELNKEELKVWDGNAWVTLVSTQNIRSWIAALNLFEGTCQEVGGTVIGAVDFGSLPDLPSATTADLSAHYFTFVGTPGYTIVAGDPNGLGADLVGAILEPGDWLQVVNRGTTAAPDMHWVHIGGDLLAKSRADALYSLNAWVDGNYEPGTLVNHAGSIWKSNVAIVTGDVAPDATGSKWSRIALTAGVKNVPTDSDLPATAPAGDVYLVLSSARAGGGPALFSYDPGATQWVQLGGNSGAAIDMSQGVGIVNVGVPVGAIMMWWTATAPAGWLICDGQSFTSAQYPELAQVLSDTKVPDLRGAFVRGAGLNGNGFWGDAARQPGSWQDNATSLPSTAFTVSTAGSHGHDLRTMPGNFSPLIGFNDFRYTTVNNYASTGGTNRSGPGVVPNGDHTHTIGGGDSETRPHNFAVTYIIKAQDSSQRLRVTTP